MLEMICIVCPRGCHLEVDEANNYEVTGNGCLRGIAYGRAEAQHPTRIVTSTVCVASGRWPRCPVKTDRPVPKQLIGDIMQCLRDITLKLPVRRGEIVLSDVLKTGANIVVTRDLDEECV